MHDRERALAELLCDRLQEEPDGPELEVAIRTVWEDILHEQLRVTEAALDALFCACGRSGGGGLPSALELLRDAMARKLLTKATRDAAVISIIKWCKEDNTSFSKILGALGEADQREQAAGYGDAC